MNVQANPVVVEAEQHYWRRRANRQVRQARWTSRLHRWSAVGLGLIIIGAALFQAASHAVEELKEQGGLTVERIEIEGAEGAGLESIRNELTPFVGQNIVDLNLYDVVAAAESDPWVLSSAVKRVLPGTLRVTVSLRRPVAAALIDGHVYLVDPSGYVIGKRTEEHADLSLLVGLDALEDDALVAALARGARAVLELQRAADGWMDGVAELDLSSPDRIAARTVDPGPMIWLDPVEVGRNLNLYREMRGEIAQQAGELQYVDLRWRDRIAVMPAIQEESEMEGG